MQLGNHWNTWFGFGGGPESASKHLTRTYDGEQGPLMRSPDAFWGWNAVSSIGAYISFASTIFFVVMLIYTLAKGRQAAANPWGEGATTLEWSVPSPAPFHTHEELPRIR